MTPHAKGEPLQKVGATAASTPAMKTMMDLLTARTEAVKSTAHPVGWQNQVMAARVAALEEAMSLLLASAVQQRWDGALLLPAARRLTIEIGAIRLSMDANEFTIEVNRQVVTRESAKVDPSNPLQQASAGAQDWRAIATAGGVANPRTLPAGTPLRPR